MRQQRFETDQSRFEMLKADIKVHLDVLEMLLACDDEAIAEDPTDPRDGRARLPGFERFRTLVPIVLKRVDEDIAAGRIHIEREDSTGEITTVLSGLRVILRALGAFTLYYEHEQLERAVDELEATLIDAQILLNTPRDDYPGRLYRDIAKLIDDIEACFVVLRGFHRQTSIQLNLPDPGAQHSPDQWFQFYLEQARRDDPLIDAIESAGMSQAAFILGYNQMEENDAQLDAEMTDYFIYLHEAQARDEVYDELNPEAFLELDEITDLSELELEDVLADSGVEFELHDSEWDTYDDESFEGDLTGVEIGSEDASTGFDDFNPDLLRIKLDKNKETTSDPIFQMLDSYFRKLQPFLLESRETEDLDPTAIQNIVNNYIILLMLKPQVHILSSDVWVKITENQAPLHGAYLFAIHCLDRIAEAAERFRPDDDLKFAHEARRIKKEITKRLPN